MILIEDEEDLQEHDPLANIPMDEESDHYDGMWAD